jgi:demethylmenaquinone methyltransferase/2-methoxy-6-polyprenyl-1,4-benzoquinol methylase
MMDTVNRRATLEKQPADVAAMFDEVADRYDVMNVVMTGGLERWWRRQVTATLAPTRGERVLDLAAGTATSSTAFARSGATVVGADFSLGMLRAGRGRGVRLPLVAGDGLRLPFQDQAFDAVTISFGLRNVLDVDACLRELLRVTRPGGRLLICEVSRPGDPFLRRGHEFWLRRGLPLLSRLLSSDPDAYSYLVESMLAWPSQTALAERIRAAGWSDVAWRDLTLGVVALHQGTRPAAKGPHPAP